MRISDWSSDVCSSDLGEQPAVDSGQPFLLDLGAQPRLDRAVVARSEIEIDQLGAALAHAGGQIGAGDDEVAAAIVTAAHHDMGMRVAGVEMIDRDPVEPRSEIGFDSRHQPPGERLEIVILIAVLGRDDEAELMAIALAAVEERLAVDAPLPARVTPSRPPLPPAPPTLGLTH